MIRKQGVLYLLCIFFLTSFGEPNNQQLSKNSTTKNNSNTKQKNYYAKHKLIDTFNNPVQVNRDKLLVLLKETYNQVMLEWYKEWKELESKR